MRTDYFVLMNASGVTSNEKVVTRFRRFRTIEEAEKMVWDWLEYFLDVRCVPEAQEAELRKSHYGMLPEDVFICPTVETPADLTKYNDFYDLGGLGRIFNIISGKSSEEGRRMKACLDAFLQSFESDAPVDPEAEEALMSFIERGGFSIIGD